jgi:putative transcription factor
MEYCEICGKAVSKLYEVRIEGAKLSVCAKCGNKKEEELHSFAPQKRNQIRVKPMKNEMMAGEKDGPELLEDYGKRMREARDRMKIPLKVMAEMLNEKETYLRRVEAQETLPTNQLIAKLEKFLKIKLSVEE